MKFLTRMAKSFVAGETIDEALQVVKKLKEKGIMSTLDILGESVEKREDSDKAVKAYLDLLDSISESGIESHVSLKLTQMGLDIDDGYCLENMIKIVSQARKYNNNFVRFDMEGSPHVQRTLDIFYKVRKEYDNVGIVVQSMLFRTKKDVEELNRIKAKVRLCKGAYKESEDIAHQKMKDVRQSFIELGEMLFADGVYPAIATHDDKLIQWTKDYVKLKNITHQDFEFQMLYGIRPKTLHKLAEEGYNARVYVPFGTHWLPYFYRRLRERKENIWFLIKNLFKK
jgi:proline dehydrogenase